MTAPSAAGFDIRDIPFSRRGAWFDVSPVVALHETRENLHLVSHQTGMHAVLGFEPCRDGVLVSTTTEVCAAALRWIGEDGTIEAVFDDEGTLRLRGRSLDLRIVEPATELTPFTGTYLFQDPVDGAAVFTSYETGRRYRVTAVSGALTIVGAELLGAAERAVTAGGDEWEIVIEEYEAARAPFVPDRSFDSARDAVAAEFDDYVDRIAPWRTESTPAAIGACYVLWSATVSPRGFLERESILMSKHWMDKVWSWDHCFNALALSPGLPAEALDQFLVVFDLQDGRGALPDSVTHSEVLYNFVKPPIHGWALRRLRASLPAPLDLGVLQTIYDLLVRWTGFWLENRRVPGHALAHYQHGNDSGWDNATMFDRDRVVEAPDLAAFLTVQLDVLADLATELGLENDAARWRTACADMGRALLELWEGDAFVARSALSGRASKTTSLLTTLPIIAADHLPDQVVRRVAETIAGHLTEFGPATQRVDTDEYEADGYWRGPIWAPSTALVEHGLRHSGHDELADVVSDRFRRLCERSGFAENFDALTGDALRDRAYTWTASCYLVLAREAMERTRGREES